MTQIPSQLLTVSEFLAAYRIGRSSLYREANAGRIALRKFGRATLIARADAERWAENLRSYKKGATDES